MAKERAALAEIYGIKEEDLDDPKLQEFMEVMKPRAQGRTWANDDADTGASAVPLPPLPTEKRAKKKSAPKVKASLETVTSKRPGGEVCS